MKTKPRQRRIPFENTPICPYTIAYHVVCSRPYNAQEWSPDLTPMSEIIRIETRRKAMTEADMREFGDLCVTFCEKAYNNFARWYDKLLKAQGRRGVDQLAVFITHWMTGYLTNPDAFRKKVNGSAGDAV